MFWFISGEAESVEGKCGPCKQLLSAAEQCGYYLGLMQTTKTV